MEPGSVEIRSGQTAAPDLFQHPDELFLAEL